jgi:hypothetical protein
LFFSQKAQEMAALLVAFYRESIMQARSENGTANPSPSIAAAFSQPPSWSRDPTLRP